MDGLKSRSEEEAENMPTFHVLEEAGHVYDMPTCRTCQKDIESGGVKRKVHATGGLHKTYRYFCSPPCYHTYAGIKVKR